MRSDTRAEITRLSAVAGADPLVKLCLMKTSYLFCMATQVRWMVIGARNEALVRQYRRLGFTDLFDDGRMYRSCTRAGSSIKCCSSMSPQPKEHGASHVTRLYEFIFETVHPDIELFSTQPALPRREPAKWIATRRHSDAPRRETGTPIRQCDRTQVGRRLVN